MKKGSGGSATPGPFYFVLDAIRKQGEQAMGSHEEQVALLQVPASTSRFLPSLSPYLSNGV